MRWLLSAVLLALILAGLAMLLLPRWVQGPGMALASQALGRAVAVDQVSVQPWRLALTLQGLRVEAVEAGDVPQLEVARIEAALSLRSLWQRALVLERLQIESPQLRLRRTGAGRWDFDDLIQRWAQPSAAGEAGPALVLRQLSLIDGQIEFEDRVLGRSHRIDALALQLPWLSLREVDAERPIEPQVSLRLDGAELRAQAQIKPFAAKREASVALDVVGLSLQPWMAYAPTDLPLQLRQGMLDAALRLRYAQAPGQASELSVSGRIGAREIALVRPPGSSADSAEEVLAWRSLTVELADVQPLVRRVHLSAIELEAPELRLRRDASGRVLLPGLSGPSSYRGAAAAEASPAASAAPSWQLVLDQLRLRQGRLVFQDHALRPAAGLGLEALDMKLQGLRWPIDGQTPPARLELQASLKSAERRQDASRPALLQASAALSAEVLSLDGSWRDLSLSSVNPYLQALLPLSLRGRSSADWQLAIERPLMPQALDRLVFNLRDLRLDELQALRPQGGELGGVAQLRLDRLGIEPAARRVQLGQLRLIGPRLQVQRAADGRLELPAWPAAGSESGRAPASPSAPWAVQIEELALTQGRLLFGDASVQRLVRRDADASAQVLVDQLQARLRALSWGGAKSPAASPASLSFQIARPDARRDGATPGRLDWQGRLTLSPLQMDGQLRAERLPLTLADPYLGELLPLHLRRGEAGFRGRVALGESPQGWRGQVQGALLVADLRLLHTRREEGRRQAGEDLLSWQSLDLAGLDFALEPAAPARLAIERASLGDFYARLIVDEAGHFNLGELGGKAARRDASAAEPAADAPALQLRIGETRLNRGSIDFSDRFIRPNYSAHLSELSGSLGRFASGDAAMAPLLLTGRVEGTGQLQISGQLNPSGDPLAMDISASATDIELAPLSPYAGKYAGYAIERGKLSSRVHYKIEPGGQLQADNQIILNQLSFGERIESPSATKLPVLLAVALLKDRHGVIDVNLPISGSIRDPDFSVGGLILRLVLNLLGKALTAPFSLLAGGSGAAELSQMAFAPGSAVLVPQAQAQLDRLAESLRERPGLSLTLTGWAQAEAERAALQAQALDKDLLAERRRELRRQQNAKGRAAAESLHDSESFTPAERTRLLTQVYQGSKLGTRPRNLLGLLKDIPVAEMETLLLAGYDIGEGAVRELALARAVALRDALIARGVANERLFLASPKLAEPEPGKPWTPRVDLSLATQ